MTAFLLAQAETFGEGLLNHYGERLGSFEGIAVIVAGLLVAAIVLAVDGAKWAVLAGGIYVATFSIKRPESLPQLPSPFRQIGEWSQAISFGAVALLAIAALRPTEWRRSRLLHPALFALLALQLAISARQTSGGFATKGLAGMVVYVVMFLILGAGISRWLYDERQVRNLARAVSWSAGLLVLASVTLLAFSYSAAFAGPRLMGTTANPQRLGAMLGMTLPFSLALFTDRRSPPYTRVAHAAIAAFGILMVVASGSRTGFLLVLIGCAVFYRARLGPALLALVVVGGIGLVGSIFLLGEAVDDAGSLVVRTNNSRAEIWTLLWETFLTSPLIGTPMEGVPGESSYLSALVMAGVIGFLPLAVLVVLLQLSAIKVVRRRRALGSLGVFGDAAAASVAQMLAAWAFEAFALGSVTDHMLVVYCTFALLGLLRERLADPTSAADGAATGLLVADAGAADNPLGEYDADHHLPKAI
jgi:hypothetical protein